MEFGLKAGNEIDFFYFFFLKLDRDLATKLLSSQKALRPTFSTCFSYAKRPKHLPCPHEIYFPKDRALEVYQTHTP